MSQTADITDIARQAAILVGKAQALGLVLTITNKPLQPLAMGNHAPDIDVRPAREHKGMPTPNDARTSSKTAGDRAWAEGIAGAPSTVQTPEPSGPVSLSDLLSMLAKTGNVEVYLMGPELDEDGTVH